ncbi:otospiralin-like [Diretmus argenteus]
MCRLPLTSLLLSALILGLLSLSETRVKRDVPNWALTSSDFFGWVEELRKHAGYEKIEDLARTFWAHFPSADRLGYGTHDPEE